MPISDRLDPRGHQDARRLMRIMNQIRNHHLGGNKTLQDPVNRLNILPKALRLDYQEMQRDLKVKGTHSGGRPTVMNLMVHISFWIGHLQIP